MTKTTVDVVQGAAKAVLAGVITFVSTTAANAGDGVITAGEWWGAAAAGLVALGAVYGVSNTGPFSGTGGKHGAP